MYEGRIDTCANRIRKALDMRAMKQADLCRITKIPKSAISQYLSGDFEPKQDRIYIISKALEVSETWLLGYDVPMERETPPSLTKEDLSEGEKTLLELFNKVPEDQQKLVLQMIRAALSSQ